MDFASRQEAPPMNFGHLILVIVLNLLVLAEVCIAMYMAAADPDNFTPVFMKAFFAMLIPTLIGGFYLKRRIGPAAGSVK